MTPVWLGQMECAGYTWTVVDVSEDAVMTALRAQYDQALENGSIWGAAAAAGVDDPLEYHGAAAVEMKEGEVQWL